MPRVQALLECLGLALCEKARRALAGDAKFGDALPDVAKAALDYTLKELPGAELRLALGELAALEPEAYGPMLKKLVDGLARVSSVPFKGELTAYLESWPATVRQTLRRPSDPSGKTDPEGIQFFKPDDLLLFLPARIPRFQPGPSPKGLDDWKLAEFRGLGECSEVWLGTSEQHAEHSPSVLKFASDAAAAADMIAHQNLFIQVFDLNDQAGIVPLRGVYLETDPPCLDVAFVYGYDLTSLIYDWKWRYDSAKPEASLKIVKRIAEIVGKAHARGIVHRDLKPSNVLLHPSEGGKFTIWVSDFGWGQIQAKRSMELGRGGTPRGEQQRLALRGAHTPLYASPQLAKKDGPDPRDDVHALGAIWYQLLKRDPHAPPPVGTDWVEQFRPAGFTDSQARLLISCLATRPEKRPVDAVTLAEMLGNVAISTPNAQDGSRLISIKSQSGDYGNVGKAGPPASVLSGGGVVKVGRAIGPVSGAMPQLIAMGDAEADGLPRLIPNGIGMTFALIPAGKYLMGSHDSEPGRRGNFEGPRHAVEITRPFYISVFPVTQGQYEKVVGKNPAHFTRTRGGGSDHPVESVAWHEAEQFCQKLSIRSEEEIHDRAYRIPSEAEWEYACRGGTNSYYSFGDKITQKLAHYTAAGAFATTGGKGHTAPVGQYPPNPYGLYDMHGNVQEWVSDWYDDYYYNESPPTDPQGPDRGSLKVVRGGCFAMIGSDCRCAARRPHDPNSFTETVGFRVVLAVG